MCPAIWASVSAAAVAMVASRWSRYPGVVAEPRQKQDENRVAKGLTDDGSWQLLTLLLRISQDKQTTFLDLMKHKDVLK